MSERSDIVFWNAFGRTRYELDRAEIQHAFGAMMWFMVGYQLGGPWRDLSWSVITGKHHVRSKRRG